MSGVSMSGGLKDSTPPNSSTLHLAALPADVDRRHHQRDTDDEPDEDTAVDCVPGDVLEKQLAERR
eukprot:scaffold3234_cov105-Isochrysis_galbana.AAC.6